MAALTRILPGLSLFLTAAVVASMSRSGVARAQYGSYGLRGCFAYVHIADPNNKIWELDEVNNAGQVIVRLPFRQKDRRGGCPGPDRGVRYGRSPYEPY